MRICDVGFGQLWEGDHAVVVRVHVQNEVHDGGLLGEDVVHDEVSWLTCFDVL